MSKKLLIIQVAGLSHAPVGSGLSFQPIGSVFPAVTCTVQASFRTATAPAAHGMIANGLYHRPLRRPMFWEQSAGLVAGERIWSDFRKAGGAVGLMFWQQSLGEDADVILTPAPIHKHRGGMIEDCYAQPAGLYQRLCKAVGRRFRLKHYWGPMASAKAGDWIAEATAALLADAAAPDLLLTYLPTLDYDLQRHGPGSERCTEAGRALDAQLKMLLGAADQAGYEVCVFGDYAIGAVIGAALPNVALADTGLLATRTVGRMIYPDFHNARAFAMVDHEIAHVYVRDPKDISAAADVLASMPGEGALLDRDGQREAGIDHANSGELVLIADEGLWLAYPWWTDNRQAPDYASHVDIHNKPGFDPCELFLDWLPVGVSQDVSRILGSHGRVGPGREVVYASTLPLAERPANLIELAQAVRTWLNASS